MSENGFKKLHVLKGISSSLVSAAAETIGPGITVRFHTLRADNESYCDISPLVIIITIYNLHLLEEAFVAVRLAGPLGIELAL